MTELIDVVKRRRKRKVQTTDDGVVFYTKNDPGYACQHLDHTVWRRDVVAKGREFALLECNYVQAHPFMGVIVCKVIAESIVVIACVEHRSISDAEYRLASKYYSVDYRKQKGMTLRSEIEQKYTYNFALSWLGKFLRDENDET